MTPTSRRTRKPSRKFAEAAGLIDTPVSSVPSPRRSKKKKKKTNEKKKRDAKYWTETEHQLFLQGLERYGRGNWKEIAAIVQTRDWGQVQTHAQFYLNKIRKQQNQETLDESSSVTAAAALVELNTTTVVTKKRKVIPFAIPSRGDESVGASQALARVVEPWQSDAGNQQQQATQQKASVSAKKPPPLVPIQQHQQEVNQHSSHNKMGEVAMRSRPWTQQEDMLLKQYFQQGLDNAEIAKKIPGRSTIACTTRLSFLGIVPFRRRRQQQEGTQSSESTTGEVATRCSPWTQEEDALLKQYYQQGLDHNEISKKIPGRSTEDCSTRVQTLDLIRPWGVKWSQEEDLLLKQNYEQGIKCADIAKLLPRRSEAACRSRIASLGLGGYLRDGFNVWTREEDELLKQYYEQGLGYKEIAKILTTHPAGSCKTRAGKLGYSSGGRRTCMGKRRRASREASWD